MPKSVHVVNRVVDTDTDRDRGDRNRHEIQRDIEPSHQPENNEISVFPVKFRHIIEVHSIETCYKS